MTSEICSDVSPKGIAQEVARWICLGVVFAESGYVTPEGYENVTRFVEYQMGLRRMNEEIESNMEAWGFEKGDMGPTYPSGLRVTSAVKTLGITPSVLNMLARNCLRHSKAGVFQVFREDRFQLEARAIDEWGVWKDSGVGGGEAGLVPEILGYLS